MRTARCRDPDARLAAQGIGVLIERTPLYDATDRASVERVFDPLGHVGLHVEQAVGRCQFGMRPDVDDTESEI